MVVKKKRGRKPEKDHLVKAKLRLQLLRNDYNQNYKQMKVPERTKLRNKISALQSRIKRREEDNCLQGELQKLKTKLSSLVDVIGDFVDE
mmetsp:Transcript_35489/g.46695  ORF Transcript_35489/g.46695 Transcript_35489/m.46695 type:complete len:90 (+) Transcript_35489:1059-1328(+)